MSARGICRRSVRVWALGVSVFWIKPRVAWRSGIIGNHEFPGTDPEP
jgi:hypothetical protein